ncbi:hypothetical protein FOA52_003511 [Chlamydomonas sp. UWO 241]|nr:hypothetical protein FOA52_003511 [Chlamydomonas sp. UWO 241]
MLVLAGKLQRTEDECAKLRAQMALMHLMAQHGPAVASEAGTQTEACTAAACIADLEAVVAEMASELAAAVAAESRALTAQVAHAAAASVARSGAKLAAAEACTQAAVALEQLRSDSADPERLERMERLMKEMEARHASPVAAAEARAGAGAAEVEQLTAANAALKCDVAELQGQLEASRAGAATAQARIEADNVREAELVRMQAAVAELEQLRSDSAERMERRVKETEACHSSAVAAAEALTGIRTDNARAAKAERNASDRRAKLEQDFKTLKFDHGILKSNFKNKTERIIVLMEEVFKMKAEEHMMVRAFVAGEERAAKLQDKFAALTRRLGAVSAAKHNFQLRSVSALEAIARREAALVAATGGAALPLSKELCFELTSLLEAWRFPPGSAEVTVLVRAPPSAVPPPSAAPPSSAATNPTAGTKAEPRSAGSDSCTVLRLVSESGSSRALSEGSGIDGAS